MKKLAVFVLISALLCCSACGTEQIPPPTPTASPEQQSSEVLVLEARVAELEEELAAALERAVERVLDEGYRTADILSPGMKKVGCTQMGDLVAARI